MTRYDTQEQESILRPLDVLETELIEADLAEILGRPSDFVRVYEDDTVKRDAADVIGWTVYGDVFIDRHMLPVCGYLASGKEDPDHTAHRRQILDVIAGAHAAGRFILHGVDIPPIEPGTIGFDLVVPDDASDAEVVEAMTDALRGLATGRAA